MGQQQLLLLVLGIVIVGISVVAGMNAYNEGKTKADRNAATTDAMRIVTAVQGWKLKPVSNGGGAAVSGFSGVSFSAVGVPPENLVSGKYPTSTACLALAGGESAVLTVYEKDCETQIAEVTIAGSAESDLSWEYPS